MPTYTAIAFDRLIEPRHEKSNGALKNAPGPKLERRNTAPNPEKRNTSATAPIDKKHHWAGMSPALYATPKSTPLPDTPSSFPPSPYIINHKRRGPRLLKSSSEDDVATDKQALHSEKVTTDTEHAEAKVADSAVDVTFTVAPIPVEEENVNVACASELGRSDLADGLALNSERVGDAAEDFFDPRESMSVRSSTEVESTGGAEQSINLNTPTAEFFDAWEELSSDTGPQPSLYDVEAELRDMRLSLLMEIEKRKQAEEALSNMKNQWLRIQQQLSLVGLTIPATLVAAEEGNLEVDPAEELCRQVYLARFVSNSIGRGIAKAEAEMEMEAEIELKNFEIARLCDRLHYYEAVNREMSQRNQEAVDIARRLRLRKKRQRLLWGSIGAAVTLGTAGLAWYFLPSGRGSTSTSQSVAPPERNNHVAK